MRVIVMTVYYLAGVVILGLAVYIASNLRAISKSRLNVQK